MQTPTIKVEDTVVVSNPEQPEWYLIGAVDAMHGYDCHVVEPNGAVGWWAPAYFNIEVISDELVEAFRGELVVDLKIWATTLEQGGAIPTDLMGHTLDRGSYTRGQRFGLQWVVTHD